MERKEAVLTTSSTTPVTPLFIVSVTPVSAAVFLIVTVELAVAALAVTLTNRCDTVPGALVGISLWFSVVNFIRGPLPQCQNDVSLAAPAAGEAHATCNVIAKRPSPYRFRI